MPVCPGSQLTLLLHGVLAVVAKFYLVIGIRLSGPNADVHVHMHVHVSEHLAQHVCISPPLFVARFAYN